MAILDLSNLEGLPHLGLNYTFYMLCGDISGKHGAKINYVAVCGGFTHLEPYMHWTTNTLVLWPGQYVLEQKVYVYWFIRFTHQNRCINCGINRLINPSHKHTYGPQYMYTCIRTRRPHKVIVSARSTLSYDVCLRHKAWDDRLLYKVYERRPRSQCV